MKREHIQLPTLYGRPIGPDTPPVVEYSGLKEHPTDLKAMRKLKQPRRPRKWLPWLIVLGMLIVAPGQTLIIYGILFPVVAFLVMARDNGKPQQSNATPSDAMSSTYESPYLPRD